MKANTPIMFSKDKKRFRAATFIQDCGTMSAVKIKMGGEEWTVRAEQVFNLSDYQKAQADNFYLENVQLLHAWNHRAQGVKKSEIARSVNMKPNAAYGIFKQAEKLGLI